MNNLNVTLRSFVISADKHFLEENSKILIDIQNLVQIQTAYSFDINKFDSIQSILEASSNLFRV